MFTVIFVPDMQRKLKAFNSSLRTIEHGIMERETFYERTVETLKHDIIKSVKKGKFTSIL